MISQPNLETARSLFLIVPENSMHGIYVPKAYIRPCLLTKDEVLQVFNGKLSVGRLTLFGMCYGFNERFDNLSWQQIKLKCALVGIEPDFKVVETYETDRNGDPHETTKYYDFETQKRLRPWWEKR